MLTTSSNVALLVALCNDVDGVLKLSGGESVSDGFSTLFADVIVTTWPISDLNYSFVRFVLFLEKI
jgi:hypothetical protein